MEAPEIAETQAWVRRAVVGLNLCPFAKAPLAKAQIRYVLSAAIDTDALLAQFVVELHALVAADPQRVETTLMIHPKVLTDFLDFNDFLDRADRALDDTGLAGILQLASFHRSRDFFEFKIARNAGNFVVVKSGDVVGFLAALAANAAYAFA